MRISLTLDIPKELNDMSRGETAKLAMELKKIIDELNFHLNRIDDENFSDEFRQRFENRMATVETKIAALEEKTAAM